MRQRFSRREIFFLIFALAAGLTILGAFILMNAVVASRLKPGGDFLLPWRAARAAFFEQADPYTGMVPDFVQSQVYGRGALQGEKPYILDTPLFLLLLYFPAGAVQSSLVVRALFLFLSEAALLVLIILGLRLADWRPRLLYLALLFLLSALSFYSLWSLIQGSPVLLLAILYAGILLSLGAGRDELTGMLMALCLAYWEVGGGFLILVVLWVISHSRWRVFLGMFMALFVLIVVSFFVEAGWALPWLRAILASTHWHYGFSPASILARVWPEYGYQAGLGISALLWLVLIVEWLAARRSDFRRLYWTACLTLAASPLLGWRGEIQNLAVLLLPQILILSIVRERWRAGYWLSATLLVLVCFLPWAVLLGGFVPAAYQQPLVFLFPPLFCVVGIYWIRWWALRPARTWLERTATNGYR